MLNFIMIGILGSVIAALSQIILKTGARKKMNGSKFLFFVNIYTVIGYFLMLAVTVINLYVFKYLDLKYALIFLPTTFILVLVLSRYFLKEKIEKRNILGYVIILFGVVIFNL